MSDMVVRAEGLSKRYRIGVPRSGYRTLRDAVPQAMRASFRRVGRLFERGLGGSDSPDTIWALRNVSFQVARGEVLGIIGRNGAGKSTLLKILSRITKPTSGSAVITGRVGSLLEVGTGFHPELTGRENIYLNGAILGMKRQEIARKFDEIVAFSEIERFLDTPVKHYSSGMYVRLAFAVAAHLEPEILVVDEVLAVGDAAFQRKCLGKIGNVASEGRTVLFVSHNMATVRSLCSHCMLLTDGRNDIQDSTDSVIDRYLALDASEISALVPLPPGPPEAPGAGISLRFLDAKGHSRSQFRLGEIWRIVLELEMRRQTPHVIAAVGLTNLESVSLITYWSKPKDLSPGRYRAEFVCDAPLTSCDIQFTVGISSYEKTFYFMPRLGRVSISDAALHEQPVRATGSGLLFSSSRPEIEVL